MIEFLKALGFIGKIILAGVAIVFAIAFAELTLNRMRGYQLVTLKTRMYWEDGKAVAGEKVKTWKIALPIDIWLQGNS